MTDRESLIVLLERVTGKKIPRKGVDKRAEIAGWDSLGHMQFILAVEDSYGVRFSLEQLSAFDSISEIEKALKERAP